MTVSAYSETLIQREYTYLPSCFSFGYLHTEMDLSAGFVITDVRVSETDRLTSARLCAFVNGQILQQVVLEISIVPGGTATGIYV